MHLFNFKVFRENKLKLPEFSYISTEPEPNLNVKYLQWLNVSSENVNIEIVMTDGSIKKGLAEPEIKNLKEGEIIQFERFGFVKLNKKDKEKYKFFFTHK
jgi:glutamyl-tRNA synthetase